jgi:AsmA protein
MKKLLVVVAAIVVLVIAAAVVVPMLVPLETYKQEVVQQVRNATGRDLRIGGEVKLSLFPSLALEVNDVAFANASWASTPDMAKLSRLDVALKILPLLSGKVEVDRFVLVDPVINLEIDKQGRPNWRFETATPAETKSKQEGAEKPATAKSGAPALPELHFGDVRLVNGTVTYLDAAKQQRFAITAVNMTVSLPSLDDPLKADGELTWNGEAIDLNLGVENPRKLLAGTTTPVALKVSSKPVSLSFQGEVTQAEPLRVNGTVTLDVPSVRKLAAWTGHPLEVGGSGLEPFSLKGMLALNGPKLSFTGAEIALDEIKGEGEVSVDTGGAKPDIRAMLDVETLDLNPYLGGKGETQAAEPAKAGTKKQEPGDWSDDPIDLSALDTANADLSFSAAAIRFQEIKIGPSAVKVTLKDRVLITDLSRLELYGGNGHARLAVDGSGPVPAIKESFAISGVQAQPLLADAAGFDRLEGTAEAEMAATTRGRTEREMVQALKGSGAVKFSDGAISGINLAAMVRNASSAFLDAGAGKAQKTDFAELSGTFTIQNGILKNDDLELVNPLLRLHGAGTVDLPLRTVDYRVEPKLVAALEGQGGTKEAEGITVPVVISGPWHDLSYRPDLSGVAKEILKNPEKAAEAAKGALEGLKKGGDGGKDIPVPKEAEKVLKKLFGK